MIRQIEGNLPEGWQKKDNLIKETHPTIQPGRTKNRKVTTKLMNDFFQRDLEEKEDTSEKDQKMNRLVKWWVGTKTFPLVDHSVKDVENIIGPQQHQNKLPWGTGIWTAFWLLWIAIIAGIYPIYPNTPVEVHTPGQTEQKGQTKGKIEALITEQSGSQAPNDTSRKSRTKISGKMRARNLDAESENFEDSN